jgi:hypothetical protein
MGGVVGLAFLTMCENVTNGHVSIDDKLTFSG